MNEQGATGAESLQRGMRPSSQPVPAFWRIARGLRLVPRRDRLRGMAGNEQLLERWVWAFVALGVLWRLTRYFLRFPVWGDECFVCLNLVERDYLGLTGPLRCSQVAPILFLWGELTAFLSLGSSELALRLLPLLAGLGGLFLFWRLATLVLSPLARTLAVGFLAVAIWPVSMSCLIKPYSLDLLMSCAMLVPAVQWLLQPTRSRWLWVLAVVTPVALFASYPAVFIAGGVSLALLTTAWRQPSWRVKGAYVVYNLALFAGFVGNYYLVGLAQLDREHGTVNAFLQEYWQDGFPPGQMGALLQWLVLTHTGQMFAYPIGGSNGLSILTFGLFVIGLWAVWRSRQRAMLVLYLTPFVLGLLAAFLRRYPYGASCRLTQNVAPIVCLLAGAGSAWLLERFSSPRWRNLGTTAFCSWFLVVGLGGLEADLLRPYRGEADVWVDKIVRQIRALSGPDDQIVVLNHEDMVDVVFRWELEQQRLHGRYLGYDGKVDPERLRSTSGQVWVLAIGEDVTGLEKVRDTLRHSQRTWTIADQIPYQLCPSKKKDPPLRCTVVHWVCPGTPGLPNPLPLVSCWP